MVDDPRMQEARLNPRWRERRNEQAADREGASETCWRFGSSGSSSSYAEASGSLCRRRRSRARSSRSWWSRRGRTFARASAIFCGSARTTRARPCAGASPRSARSSTPGRRPASWPTGSGSRSRPRARAWISSRRAGSPATTSRPRRPRRSPTPPSSFAASSWPGSICPIATATTSGASRSASRRGPFASRSSRRSSSAWPRRPRPRSFTRAPGWPSIRSPRRRTSTW